MVLHTFHTPAEPALTDEAPFEMANLRPATTGLPFVVFVSQRGGAARHGPRIKISPLPRFDPEQAITITLEEPPRPLGDLGSEELDLVRRWIALNRTTLEGYWAGTIAYTEDMLALIRAV